MLFALFFAASSFDAVNSRWHVGFGDLWNLPLPRLWDDFLTSLDPWLAFVLTPPWQRRKQSNLKVKLNQQAGAWLAHCAATETQLQRAASEFLAWPRATSPTAGSRGLCRCLWSRRGSGTGLTSVGERHCISYPLSGKIFTVKNERLAVESDI